MHPASYTNPFRKHLAGFLDSALVITLFIFYILFLNPGGNTGSLYTYSFPEVLLGFIVYRMIALLVVGKTLGMYLLRISLARPGRDKLSAVEKILASLFILINGVYYSDVKREL